MIRWLENLTESLKEFGLFSIKKIQERCNQSIPMPKRQL